MDLKVGLHFNYFSTGTTVLNLSVSTKFGIFLANSATTGHVARMGEETGVYRVLVGKPEGKRPLARPRRRWVDNIGMDLQEVRCGYMDWIELAQDRDRWRTR